MAGERIYLAGPDVFVRDTNELGEAKKAICAAHDFVGMFPLDKVLDLAGLTPVEAGLKISQANEALMLTCDLIIANMTPFQGPGMDGGTAFEMGFMRALGRPVLGYTNDGRLFAERLRVFAGDGLRRTVRPEGDEDGDGMLIEDFAMVDNLMMHGAVLACGADVDVAAMADAGPGDARFRGLEAFTATVRRARALLDAR